MKYCLSDNTSLVDLDPTIMRCNFAMVALVGSYKIHYAQFLAQWTTKQYGGERSELGNSETDLNV